jgi:hypothetical protein
MVLRHLVAYRLVAYVAAFVAVGSQNTLLAKHCICRNIGHSLCILDPHVDQRVDEFCMNLFKEYINNVLHDVRQAPPDHLTIVDTGYNVLWDIGGEEERYGLYSYAILNYNDRSAAFLNAVFKAIPIAKNAQPSQTNIFYIPTKNDMKKEVTELLKTGGEKPLAPNDASAYAKNLYDYEMSRTLLADHICRSRAEEVKPVCKGGLPLTGGPYIFTYAQPASKLDPVPPPFLLIDLSGVHERAFPEIVAAFLEQVVRKDFSDREKIDTFRLHLLNITLTAADWISPVQKAMADIVHIAGGPSEGNKK